MDVHYADPRRSRSSSSSRALTPSLLSTEHVIELTPAQVGDIWNSRLRLPRATADQPHRRPSARPEQLSPAVEADDLVEWAPIEALDGFHRAICGVPECHQNGNETILG